MVPEDTVYPAFELLYTPVAFVFINQLVEILLKINGQLWVHSITFNLFITSNVQCDSLEVMRPVRYDKQSFMRWSFLFQKRKLYSESLFCTISKSNIGVKTLFSYSQNIYVQSITRLFVIVHLYIIHWWKSLSTHTLKIFVTSPQNAI